MKLDICCKKKVSPLINLISRMLGDLLVFSLAEGCARQSSTVVTALHMLGTVFFLGTGRRWVSASGLISESEKQIF